MIRNPMHAGTFYPRFADQIRRQIDNWLSGVDAPESKDRNLGLILPHAGYMYSGQCSALGMQSISNENIDTFIILHPCHSGNHFDFSLSPYLSYVNPLGTLELDSDLYQKLSPEGDQNISISYHQKEHSMEIQLPIINYFFPNARILPIMLGNQIPAVSHRLANLLYDLILKSPQRIVVLCSTDLSHYHQAARAEIMDSHLIDLIQALEPEKLWSAINEDSCEACGIGGIMTLIFLARMYADAEVKVVSYTHSGKISGNNQQVVGYLAARFVI